MDGKRLFLQMKRKFERRRTVQDFGQLFQDRRHDTLVIFGNEALDLLQNEVDGEEVQDRLGLLGAERERERVSIGTIRQGNAFREIIYQPLEQREERRDIGAGRLGRGDDLRHVELQVELPVHDVIHCEVERRSLPRVRAALLIRHRDVPVRTKRKRLHLL